MHTNHLDCLINKCTCWLSSPRLHSEMCISNNIQWCQCLETIHATPWVARENFRKYFTHYSWTMVNSIFLYRKAMTPHSSTLAWRIPWTEEPGRLQSMGLWRVGHDWVTSLSLFTFMHWRRKWQLTPVFLTGESQGRGSLVGCRLWGCTESDNRSC